MWFQPEAATIVPPVEGAVCGMNGCEPGETYTNCPQDCPAVCGDGIVNQSSEQCDGNPPEQVWYTANLLPGKTINDLASNCQGTKTCVNCQWQAPVWNIPSVVSLTLLYNECIGAVTVKLLL